MDVWDVPLDSAEPLQILLESLSFFLLDKLQITGPAWFLMAASEGANELMAKVNPQRMEFSSKCINQDLTLDLRAKGK